MAISENGSRGGINPPDQVRVKALSAHSDHYRAVDVELGEDRILGDMDSPGYIALTAGGSLRYGMHEATGTHPSSQWRPPAPRAGSWSTSYPMDDVRQTRINWGVRNGEDNVERAKEGLVMNVTSTYARTHRAILRYHWNTPKSSPRASPERCLVMPS